VKEGQLGTLKVFCKRYCCELLIISASHKYVLSEGTSSKHGTNEEGATVCPHMLP